MSLREFKQRRERACTAADFRHLAEWCRSQAELYRRNQARCDAEALEPCSQFPSRTRPPHSASSRDLHALASHYGEMSSQWIELAALCSDKAVELESESAR